ncbi:MAG TPA: energy transducer TonB [Kofleriaceae bacterium]|nr:energy transducer TonB [Kofleriaceae bacterium]
MTRADTRLVVAIVLTSVVTSTAVVAVSRTLSNTDELETRLAGIEQRLAEPPPAPPPPPVVPQIADEHPSNNPLAVCDEVTCVLNNYEGACCAPFKKTPTLLESDDPDTLDRAQISAAVARVKPLVMICGERSEVHGKVKLKVKVGPDGRVLSATVAETPDEALGRCVQHAMTRARFAMTRTGGSFSYPFVF